MDDDITEEQKTIEANAALEMAWYGKLVSQMTEAELRETVAQMGERIRRLENKLRSRGLASWTCTLILSSMATAAN